MQAKFHQETQYHSKTSQHEESAAVFVACQAEQPTAAPAARLCPPPTLQFDQLCTIHTRPAMLEPRLPASKPATPSPGRALLPGWTHR